MKKEIKNYWVYEELKKRGYKIKIKENKLDTILDILYSDNELYTTFLIEEDTDELTKGFWIYNQGQMINDEVDYDNNLEECIKSSLYYFFTRY